MNTNHWFDALARQAHSITVSDLIHKGKIKPPFELQAKYQGIDLKATIQGDGMIRFADGVYSSLSTAAGVAIASVKGRPPLGYRHEVNGWEFWSYEDARSGEVKKIGLLRWTCVKL